jgi:hypothetical protein
MKILNVFYTLVMLAHFALYAVADFIRASWRMEVL